MQESHLQETCVYLKFSQGYSPVEGPQRFTFLQDDNVAIVYRYSVIDSYGFLDIRTTQVSIHMCNYESIHV